MGLLKRKEEKTETIAVRVPSSLKVQLEELRERANASGFDLTATIADTLSRLAKQVREELDATASAQPAAKKTETPTHANGLARAGGEHSPASSSSGKEN